MHLSLRWKDNTSPAYKIYWYIIGFLIDVFLPFVAVIGDLDFIFTLIVWLVIYFGSMLVTVIAHIKYKPEQWSWNKEDWNKKERPPWDLS